MVHEDPCAKLIIPHVPAIFYTSIRHLCYCLLVEHRAYCVKLACAMRTKGRLYRVLQSEARASDKKLLGTKGIATRSKDATRGAPGLTTRNKRTLLVTKGGATRSKELEDVIY